jgi:2-keto-4-pentenoate hydratase
MRASVLVAAIAITFVTIGVSEAACPGADEIDRFLADWTAKKPTKALSVTDMADAVCARDRLVEKLRQSQGKVVGYKAGLTAKATQERFGASAPVAGILLEKMIVNDGATVPVNFGARVVWEADMLLVVKDDGINAANCRTLPWIRRRNSTACNLPPSTSPPGWEWQGPRSRSNRRPAPCGASPR